MSIRYVPGIGPDAEDTLECQTDKIPALLEIKLED